MRLHTGLTEGFWAEAMKTASHVLNRTPHKSLLWRTPHELLFSRVPDIRYLRVFGCHTWVYILKDQRMKWKPNSVPMIFVGYEPGSKAYRLWDPATRSIKVSATVQFDKTQLPCKPIPKPLAQRKTLTLAPEPPSTYVNIDFWNENPPLPWSGELPPSPPSPPSTTSSSSFSAQDPTPEPPESPPLHHSPSHTPPSAPTTSWRSTRVTKPVRKYKGGSSNAALWAFQQEGETQEEALDHAYIQYVALFSTISTPDEPRTYCEAMALASSANWMDTILSEFKAMEEMNVWEIVPRLENTNIVSCKWVFKVKHDASGEISVRNCYKIRSFRPISFFLS